MEAFRILFRCDYFRRGISWCKDEISFSARLDRINCTRRPPQFCPITSFHFSCDRVCFFFSLLPSLLPIYHLNAITSLVCCRSRDTQDLTTYPVITLRVQYAQQIQYNTTYPARPTTRFQASWWMRMDVRNAFRSDID